MKLKNIKELRLRAASHVQFDHIKQGTYGRGNVNGHAEFVGCAVGCLSTPHRKDELIKFLRKFLPDTVGVERELTITDAEQRKMLEDDFGITQVLAITAEGFFEAQITHGGAIEFIKRFAFSLVEGAEICPSDVYRFLKSNFNFAPNADELHWLDSDGESWYYRLKEHLHELATVKIGELGDDEVSEEKMRKLSEKFLVWLQTRKPAAV